MDKATGVPKGKVILSQTTASSIEEVKENLFSKHAKYWRKFPSCHTKHQYWAYLCKQAFHGNTATKKNQSGTFKIETNRETTEEKESGIM